MDHQVLEQISKKKSVNLNDMTWIRFWIRIQIYFFPVRIQDPDPHQN